MNWKLWNRAQHRLPTPDDPDWDRALINYMAADYLRGQRSRRRWSLIFKSLIFLYFVGILVAIAVPDVLDEMSSPEAHVALIEVKGTIAAESEASADNVISALRTAFETDAVKGIILRINSPGGSPVQAGYINDEIKRLKAKYLKEKEKDLPVYAVAVDLCASGGYYIAVGADAIYVDKGSLIGSIGVRIGGFGFQDLMKDIGVERRLLTAGANKGILDPFSPLPEEQRTFIQGVLNTLHQQFIAEVKSGRGDKLKGGEEVFSGLFWSGQEAVALGLADGLGSSSYVAREVIGTETIVEYTKKRDLLDSFAKRLGVSFSTGLLEPMLNWWGGAAVH
ncbi:S49 family peptidase [Chromatium okenii]|uniref:S49 family peptidase n=1 Tax=Chromatium okenii TaxID=61644 RepID=UPI0019065507|nr:S49 family peptidase [Chromatium okenii]MBK1641794.1 S49 family peptidase [Chromatium okenii]